MKNVFLAIKSILLILAAYAAYLVSKEFTKTKLILKVTDIKIDWRATKKKNQSKISKIQKLRNKFK